MRKYAKDINRTCLLIWKMHTDLHFDNNYSFNVREIIFFKDQYYYT